ncbi:hypothetical protein [Pseudomonas sp. S2_B07]|jgi:hypothetical protein
MSPLMSTRRVHPKTRRCVKSEAFSVEVGALISRAATREKRRLIYLQMLTVWAVNTLRLKAVELSSYQTPWTLS